jgi:hypothetical protein
MWLYMRMKDSTASNKGVWLGVGMASYGANPFDDGCWIEPNASAYAETRYAIVLKQLVNRLFADAQNP